MEGLGIPCGYISMFPVSSLSTPNPIRPASQVGAQSTVASPVVPKLGLLNVANRGDALTSEALTLQPAGDPMSVPETPDFDMGALLNWSGEGEPDEQRMEAALRISLYACSATNLTTVTGGAKMAHIDLRGLRLKESPPLPVGAEYFDDSGDKMKRVEYSMFERRADIFQAMVHADLHMYSSMGSEERQKLAKNLAENWTDTRLRCDRVGVEKDMQTIVAWDSRYPGKGVQARVKLESVLTR